MDESLSETRPTTVAGRRALELSIAQVFVTVEEGPDSGATATLSAASLCIGSDAACDLVLTDPTVSRKHAVLSLSPRGIALEDLESTNGTWVGGVRLSSGIIPAGSLVKVGSTALRVASSRNRMLVFPDSQDSFEGLIGRSQAMRDLFALVRQLARTDLPVLVHGETGSGKELVARALHRAGPRQAQPFVVLDCGTVVPDLIRSEVFGHEKGAFTGADRTSRGVLEEAQGGTVFLDEVGELELSVQPNLLRALETREVCRLGSRTPVAVDFRLVAATNRDLRRRVAEKAFREDLYYRIACVVIQIPPLRDRSEDVPLIARDFLARCAGRNSGAPAELTDAAVQALSAHSWPGNVRELKNVVETAWVLAEGHPIGPEHIGRALVQEPMRPAGRAASAGSLEDAERDAIVAALASTGGKKKAAARLLKISPTTLFAKLKKYGIGGDR